MSAKVFVSYAPKDESYHNELVKHLEPLQKSGVISVWHNRKILPGSTRAHEIDSHLNNADIILLLISSDFIASDYCWDIEVKQAIHLHESGKAIVIPVIVRTVDWKNTPFGKLASLPDDGRPVEVWNSIDVAMDNVVHSIQRLIEHQRKQDSEKEKQLQTQEAEKRFYQQLDLFLSDGILSNDEKEILIRIAEEEFGLTTQQAKELIAREESKRRVYASNLQRYRQSFSKFIQNQEGSVLSQKHERILTEMQKRCQLSADDVHKARNEILEEVKNGKRSSVHNLNFKVPGKVLAISATVAVASMTTVAVIMNWKNQSECPPIIGDGISSGEESVFGQIIDIPPTVFDAFVNCKGYSTVVEDIDHWLEDNPDHKRKYPEVTIYRNNAQARLVAESQPNRAPYVLAVVVPAEAENGNSVGAAKEILRGVADAQEKFNDLQDDNGKKLLEVIVADDRDDINTAKRIAKELILDNRVLGVIGHRSSEVSEEVMGIYQDANIPVISSTSTSTTLTGYQNFLRTVPSDEAMSTKLARCFQDAEINSLVLYYDSEDPYSNDWKESISSKFSGSIQPINFHTEDIQASIENYSRADGFDAVAIVSSRKYYDSALFVVKENGKRSEEEKFQLFGTDILYSNQFLKDAGQNATDMIITVPWFVDGASSYGRAASQEWSNGGTISWRHATSYEAGVAFSYALRGNELIDVKDVSQARSNLLKNLQNVELAPSDTAGTPLLFNLEGERIGHRSNPQPGEDLENYKAEVMATFVKVSPREGTAEQNLGTEVGASSNLIFTERNNCQGLIER